MAELIATGTAQADSADVVLSDGASATIGLFAAAGVSITGDCKAVVERKASNNEYYGLPDGTLGVGKREVQILGPATYRVRKYVSGVSFGVSKD